MIVISKGSIETRIKREARQRADIRRQEDVRNGLTRSTGPQRGDFKETRHYDKIMQDYRSFKNPQDREKIKREYEEAQRENRK